MESRGSFSYFRSRGPYTCLWEDRESGQKRFKTIVRADEVLFLDACQERAEESQAVADLPF